MVEIKSDTNQAAVAAAAYVRLNTGMQNNAEVLRAVAKEHFKARLNYNQAGVQWLHRFLEDARHANIAANQLSIVMFASAFLGECITHSIGGKWDWHGDDYVIQTPDGKLVSPFNKVAKQLQDGEIGGDSVLSFYLDVKAMKAPRLSKAQRLLQVLYKRHGDHQFFVAVVLDFRLQWARVSGIEDNWIKIISLPDQEGDMAMASTCPLQQIHSYFVQAPSGVMMHVEGMTDTLAAMLPEQIKTLIAPGKIINSTMAETALEQGKDFLQIRLLQHDAKQGGSDTDMYTVSIKNISAYKIKINQFARFDQIDGVWHLGSAIQNYYPAEEFLDWFNLTALWIMPGEQVSAVGKLGNPPVMWVFAGETATGDQFTAGQVLRATIANQASYSSPYYTPDLPALVEYAMAIDDLRSSLARQRKAFTASDYVKIGVGNPHWMDNSDPLSEVARQQMRLLGKGTLVWAALVQANSLLFDPGKEDCPAMLVYSKDSYFDSRPQELFRIAQSIYKLKNTEPENAEAKKLADTVTNEMDRVMGWKLPDIFTSKEVLTSVFMGYRKHLPGGVMGEVIFPILIHPDTQAVMLAPFEFWPASLLKLWKQNKLVPY